MYRTHTLSAAMRTWYRGRLKVALENALPDPILLILLPVGLLSVRETRRVVLMAGLGLFFVGYAAYLFFLEHYLLGVLPAMICLLLMAPETTRRAWPGVHRVYVFVLLFIFTVSVTSLWPVEALPLVPPSAAADQRPANALLAHLPETPAVVLFRFDPMVTSAHDDPVYNDGVAWPDDAEVVRARDLGAEADRALYRYYAKRQPNRVFYIYDPRRRAEGKNPLIGPLGTAAELAAKSG
jgi:hypothetical protein